MECRSPQPFDLKAWIKANPSSEPIHSFKSASSKSLPQPNRSKDAYSKAQSYMARAKPAISGSKGHNHTFGICCTLLKGFCLSIEESRSLLDHWNNYCVPPWSKGELENKLKDASNSPDYQPKGWMLDKLESKFSNIVECTLEEEQADAAPRSHVHSGILHDPASLAVRFFKSNQTESGLCYYRWWKNQFYKWNGKHYDMIDRDEINSTLFGYIEKEFYEQYIKDCAEVPENETATVKKKLVGTGLIENVKVGLINLISISNKNSSEPFWLEEMPGKWSPDEVIPANNRLLHIPSFISSNPLSFINKHPKYFSTFSLKYDFNYNHYDGPVEPPPVWDKTLSEIWPEDPESIDCLQEFFGYFLTPCTKLQKMLMFIGQKRSGKGTIIRVLKHMLGEENICYPTFKSLTSDFGKQQLIGKYLTVFPDARITGRTDTGDVVEILLSITGEDSQTINRKHLPHLTTHLPTRFLVASNELPRLTENSGALVSRAIVLKFDESFLDREDIELEEKLIPEIPQILRWAIDGWVRLYERKKFKQPRSGAQMVDDFLHISSPISHFLSDHIEVEGEYETDTRSLYLAWRSWCEWQGREAVGDMDGFLRNLRAAVPGIQITNQNMTHNGDGVAWSRLVKGLRIKPEPSTGNGRFNLPIIYVDEKKEGNGSGNGKNRINGLDALEEIPF